MKLASLDDGTRQGLPVVVSRDLSRCAPATSIVPSLLEALADWHTVADRLRSLAGRLEAGRGEAWRFHEAQALPPVPLPWPRDGEAGTLSPAQEPIVLAASRKPVTAGLRLAALCDGDGRARLILPVLDVVVGQADAASLAIAAPVVLTPDECDEAMDPDHPLTARLERTSTQRAEERSRPLRQALSLPRLPADRDLPAIVVITEPLCRLAVHTGDRLRATLTDARRRPVAGVIDVTVDPPAPAMAALGRSRPPLRPSH